MLLRSLALRPGVLIDILDGTRNNKIHNYRIRTYGYIIHLLRIFLKRPFKSNTTHRRSRLQHQPNTVSELTAKLSNQGLGASKESSGIIIAGVSTSRMEYMLARQGSNVSASAMAISDSSLKTILYVLAKVLKACLVHLGANAIRKNGGCSSTHCV